MVFYCKNCDKEFQVNDKECKGYYNWKCPTCMHIANKKDMALGFGIIWNCDTGTVKRNSYIDKNDKNNKNKCESEKSSKCSCCEKAS